MQKKSGIMKSGLDAMSLFLLEDLLSFNLQHQKDFKPNVESLKRLENGFATLHFPHIFDAVNQGPLFCKVLTKESKEQIPL